MERTGIDYTGWRDGKCWMIATKFAGKGADKFNATTVAKIVRNGYELREMPLSEAVDAHLEALASR